MRTLEQIRADDAACTQHADGSLHCIEPGDHVAEDRRQLLRMIDEMQRERANAKGASPQEGPEHG